MLAELLLILSMSTVSNAAQAGQDEGYRVPTGTTSMLFQYYLQPGTSSYPGGFVFALERRYLDKIGLRAGASFYGASFSSKRRGSSSSGIDDDHRDQDDGYYSAVVTALGVYHLKPEGTLQASLACGPLLEWFKRTRDYTSESQSSSDLSKSDLTFSGWGIGGHAVLDVQWRITQQVSLLGSYGYRMIYESEDIESERRSSGSFNSTDGYKGDNSRWSTRTAGASLGLVFHF